MNITIDIRLLARGGTTGIPGYTRDLVSTLLALHPEHQYGLFYNALRQHSLPEAWTSANSVTIHRSRIPNRLLNYSFGTFNGPVPAPLKSADVIFSPNLDILPITHIPRVITFHDLSFISYPEFFSPKDHVWHRMQKYQRQAQHAKRIIAVSEFTKAELVSLLKLPSDKIDVVYSGINECFEQLAPNDPKLANYRLANQLTAPFILYLGSLEPRKNIPLLIAAFNELKNDPRFSEYRLVLAGRPGYRAGEIFAAAAQSPVRDDIQFLGPVSDEERLHLYNAARVFVFPSWLEGFGFPPLEAQACGTPVVASNRASLPEILSSSALLIDPWRSGELCEAIRAIETNGKMRETIVAAGLTNAKRFSWTESAQQTLKVFEDAR